MTVLTRLTLLLIAVSLTFASSAIFLIYQYKQGIPYSFAVNMTLAVLIGLVAPLAAVVGFGMLSKESQPRTRFAIYYTVCIALAAIIGLLTF